MGSLLNAPSLISYEDFDPSFEWSREDSLDILVIDLPGFKKEHLKVQVDSGGKLRTSGNRPLDGNRWIRFWKDFRVPANCSIQAIQARFENEKLHVLFPKSVEAQKAPVPVPVPVPTPAAPPERAAAEDDKTQRQKANGKSTEPVNAGQDLDKRKEEEEKLKSNKEGKSSDAEKKTAPVPDIDDLKSKKEDKSSGAEKKTAPAPGPRQDMEDKSSGGEKKTAPTVISEPKTDGKSSDEKKMVPPPSATTWKAGDGGMEGVTEGPDKVGIAMGLTQASKGLLLNVAVATLVLLGLAFYLKHKLTKAETE